MAAVTPAPDTIQLPALAPQILPPAGAVLIYYDRASGKLRAIDSTGASVLGASTPGGSDQQVQFNDSGSFGGSVALTYDKTTQNLSYQNTIDGAAVDFVAADAGGQTSELTIDPTQAALGWMDNSGLNGGAFGIDATGSIIQSTGTLNVQISAPSAAVKLQGATGTLGFFGSTGTTQPTITGSRGGNAALASLLTAGANLGLWTDNTTA